MAPPPTTHQATAMGPDPLTIAATLCAAALFGAVVALVTRAVLHDHKKGHR